MAIANFSNGGDTHWTPSTTFTADGDILVADEFEFALNNPNPGPTQNYSIHLFSESEDGFSYDGENLPPDGGLIDHVEVQDENGTTYFTIYGSFADSSVVDFVNTLGTSGPKAALDQLVGDGLQLYGSEDGDFAETYGENGFYDLADGTDTLAISYSFTTAYGGEGDDTFTILNSGLHGLSLHGGPTETGFTPTTDTNTMVFAAAGTLFFDELDGFTNFKFTANAGQFIFLTADQLPGGSRSVFHVTGSATGRTNEIIVERGGTEALHLNLSHVTVANFLGLNRAFIFDFAGDIAPRNDGVTGVLGARNVFDFAGGNDRATGGNKADIFTGGRGNDVFLGGGGTDIANFDGLRSQFTITKLAANRYAVHDNRLHSPQGTDTLVKVEYLAFNNTYVFIGGSTTTALTHATTADSHAASAHHADFDLFT